ncbi:MAG: hypothetical protein IJ157_12370 [Clostridia bacterium]|nr:hypothetical protein [Clostridia bacterium]
MIARILCLIVLLLELRGLALSISNRKWMILVFYTQLSNLAAAVTAALLLVLGQTPWISLLRYLSACMLVMTFFVTVCVLIPMGGDPQKLLWSGSGLYHHVLCPAISTASYIFFEQHAGLSGLWLPPAITLIYGLVMLYLNGTEKVDGPYPFFRVRHQSALATVLWMTALMAVMTGISVLVWAAAK